MKQNKDKIKYIVRVDLKKKIHVKTRRVKSTVEIENKNIDYLPNTSTYLVCIDIVKIYKTTSNLIEKSDLLSIVSTTLSKNLNNSSGQIFFTQMDDDLKFFS